ncbi:MAG: Rid family hydrolase [Spirochaetota bacterium]
MMKHVRVSPAACYSVFTTSAGADEYHIVIGPEPDSFAKALTDAVAIYTDLIKSIGLSMDTQVFTRIHTGDLSNQFDSLHHSKLYDIAVDGGYSFVEQSPLNDRQLTFFAYHVKNAKKPLMKTSVRDSGRRPSNHVSIAGEHYTLFYAANYQRPAPFTSYDQTKMIFEDYDSFLHEHGQTLLDNVIRTWMFVRDIGNHYRGMVDARREYFNEHGLTKYSRYLASTGIEGRSRESWVLVDMDALSYAGIREEQIVRMEAPENMCPTHDYNVTFERGVKVTFGDREQMFISGTASIDNKGEILFPADARKQTERAVENIRALLKPNGSDLADLAYAIVYLRCPADARAVLGVLDELFPKDLPVVRVHAPVCRPGWLVEIEGVAIRDAKHSVPDFL